MSRQTRLSPSSKRRRYVMVRRALIDRGHPALALSIVRENQDDVTAPDLADHLNVYCSTCEQHYRVWDNEPIPHIWPCALGRGPAADRQALDGARHHARRRARACAERSPGDRRLVVHGLRGAFGAEFTLQQVYDDIDRARAIEWRDSALGYNLRLRFDGDTPISFRVTARD